MKNKKSRSMEQGKKNSLRAYLATILIVLFLISQHSLAAVGSTPNLAFEVNYAPSESDGPGNFNLNSDSHDFLFSFALLSSSAAPCNGTIGLVRAVSNSHVSIPGIRAPPFPY